MSTAPDRQPEMPAALAQAMAVLRAADSNAAQRINLVPSEARMSPLARQPLSTDLYFRYFFNEQADPLFWQFRGGQETGHLEHELAIPALRRLSGATHVNIRPLSGLNAMLLVISALGGEIGSSIVCLDPRSGGHFATESLIRRLGRHPIAIAVREGRVDEDALAVALTRDDVPLVYLDLQNTLTELDVAGAAAVIARHSPGTRLHYDASHTLGLVLGRAHTNPLDAGADSFGGSTHKSFPGPQKGIVLTRDPTIAARLKEAQFDLISSHHFAETIALGLAAAEFEVFGQHYARQVVDNARVLARCLSNHGFEVASGGSEMTDTHQVWMQHGSVESVTRLADRLAAAGIAANVQDDLPGQRGPAFRLGVNETTFEGASVEAMRTIADAFAHARDGAVPISAAEIRQMFGAPYHFSESALARNA
jgi:glycine hydroxymethyltransferase